MPAPWQYRYDPVDPLLDLQKLVARVLVAKLSSRWSFQDWAESIDQTCRAVPLIQNDSGWTCRTWAMQALSALRALEGDFATIPDLQDGNMEEGEIIAFAQVAKTRLLAGHVSMGDIHAIELFDMRR
ncbi:hypothetical protein C8R43DRAFT_1241542 [Mycena crocata]|nr:hypothetical protein C8R43DRAFT_1241542 [Mycena crocata]